MTMLAGGRRITIRKERASLSTQTQCTNLNTADDWSHDSIPWQTDRETDRRMNGSSNVPYPRTAEDLHPSLSCSCASAYEASQAQWWILLCICRHSTLKSLKQPPHSQKPPDLNHVSRLHHNPLPTLFNTLSAPTANWRCNPMNPDEPRWNPVETLGTGILTWHRWWNTKHRDRESGHGLTCGGRQRIVGRRNTEVRCNWKVGDVEQAKPGCARQGQIILESTEHVRWRKRDGKKEREESRRWREREAEGWGRARGDSKLGRHKSDAGARSGGRPECRRWTIRNVRRRRQTPWAHRAARAMEVPTVVGPASTGLGQSGCTTVVHF